MGAEDIGGALVSPLCLNGFTNEAEGQTEEANGLSRTTLLPLTEVALQTLSAEEVIVK